MSSAIMRAQPAQALRRVLSSSFAAPARTRVPAFLRVESSPANPSRALPARSFATSYTPANWEERPDYYRVLGVRRDANADQIKQAFREQAKLHHPDTKSHHHAASHKGEQHSHSAEKDLAAFRLINEAYSVLGNPASRREYDQARFGGGKGVTTQSLRARNEGVDGFDRPTSIYTAGPEWATLKGTAAAGAAQGASASTSTTAAAATAPPAAAPPSAAAAASSSSGYGATGEPFSGYSAEDNKEAFRLSMERASERQRDAARMRATLARLNRPRVEVPTRGSSAKTFLIAAGVAALWGANFYFFGR